MSFPESLLREQLLKSMMMPDLEACVRGAAPMRIRLDLSTAHCNYVLSTFDTLDKVTVESCDRLCLLREI